MNLHIEVVTVTQFAQNCSLLCPPDGGPAVLIGGELIFMGSIGRTDLPRGDLRQLVRSVLDKIWVLPDETTILPGHGPTTTIGFEKKVNPFVSLDAIEDLVG